MDRQIPLSTYLEILLFHTSNCGDLKCQRGLFMHFSQQVVSHTLWSVVLLKSGRERAERHFPSYFIPSLYSECFADKILNTQVSHLFSSGGPVNVWQGLATNSFITNIYFILFYFILDPMVSGHVKPVNNRYDTIDSYSLTAIWTTLFQDKFLHFVHAQMQHPFSK